MLADNAILIVCKAECTKFWDWIFPKIIWWWQCGCSDGWTPECVTKLGCEVKMCCRKKSYCSKYVGSFMIWHRLNGERAISILDPPKVFILFWHQPCVLVLKSFYTTTRNGHLLTLCTKLSLKFLMKFSIRLFFFC